MQVPSSGVLPPLLGSVILYADDSPESAAVQSLLAQAGIHPFVTDGIVEPLQRKPLILFWGGCFQGVSGCEGLLRLLRHWHAWGLRNGVFAET